LAASDHLPPVELPDLEKKTPRPKFIAPEKKTGVPTASKLKPEPGPRKSAARKAAKPKVAKTPVPQAK
jgi:excinuclease ABC subunit A